MSFSQRKNQCYSDLPEQNQSSSRAGKMVTIQQVEMRILLCFT